MLKTRLHACACRTLVHDIRESKERLFADVCQVEQHQHAQELKLGHLELGRMRDAGDEGKQNTDRSYWG